MGDVTKLPKWAQDRIALLERDLEHAHSKFRQMESGDTEVFIRDYQRGDIPLPKGSRIVFVVPGGEIQGQVGDEGFEVYGSATRALYHLAFLPRSANHGIVRVVDR